MRNRRSRGAGWVTVYGWWYTMAALPGFAATLNAVAGNWPGCALNAAPAVVIGIMAARSHVRRHRDGGLRLRAELSALVTERARATEVPWLNRKEHLAFLPSVSGRFLLRAERLTVVDEDQARDVTDTVDAGGGRVALTGTFYHVLATSGRVLRTVDGVVVLATAAGLQDTGEGRQWWWRKVKGALASMWTGHAYADTTELAEVITRFRAAEPLSPAAAP
jgi:hypothetical protein